MQVVQPGTIKCDLCDDNPNVRRLEALVLQNARAHAGYVNTAMELLDGYKARVEELEASIRMRDEQDAVLLVTQRKRIHDLGMSFGIEFFTGDDDELNPNWAQLEGHGILPLGTIDWKVTGRGQSVEEAIIHALLLALTEKVARVG
jgi:hypothetical protein